MRNLILVFAAVLAAMLLAGCGSEDETDANDTTTSLAPPETTTQLAPPGLYDLSDGRKQALGVLDFRDLEGGFWAIVGAYPGEAYGEAQVVTVLANAENIDADLEALRGTYVRAEGELLDGASVRMAGPEMEVEELAPVSDERVLQEEAPSNDY